MRWRAITLVVIGMVVRMWGRVVQRDKGDFVPPILQCPILPMVALGLQFIGLRWTEGSERFIPLVLSHVLLWVFVVVNWQHRALRIMAIGLLLNLIPMTSNGGYMPITPQAMMDLHPGTTEMQWTTGFTHVGSKDMVLPADQSRFWFLGDVFVLRSPFPNPTAFSLGDLIIVVGLGWTVYRLVSPGGIQHEPVRLGSSRLCRRRKQKVSSIARARSTGRD